MQISKRILLMLCLAVCVNSSYAQVYKKPDGKAEASSSAYKKFIVPDSLKSFYTKIDEIQSNMFSSYTDARGNSVNRFYYSGFSYLYTPKFFNAVFAGPNSGGDNNDFYNDYMTSFIKGQHEDFLTKMNQAMDHYKGLNGDMNLEEFLYYRFFDECNILDYKGGQDIFDKVIEKMSKNAKGDSKKSLINEKDLAIAYAEGVDLSKENYGKINIDYPKSLAFIEEFGKHSGSKEFSEAYNFIYKIVKAYDLLNIGISQKDANDVKLSADLYADVWNSYSEKSKWDNMFKQLYTVATSYTCSYCERMYGQKYVGNSDFHYYANSGMFDQYFVESAKVQLVSLIFKSCYQMQILSPEAKLSNGLKPADFSASVYKSFITNF